MDARPDAREVVIVEYDPRWPALFEAERDAIFAAAGEAIQAVHHAGSTSVPGLAAKPILDFVIELAEPLGEKAIEALGALGYDYRGEYGIAERQYFSRRDGQQAHLHCYVRGQGDYQRMLTLRDYLRTHPEAAEEYAALKRELAVTFRFDREGYTDAKAQFVHRIEALAQAATAT